MIYRVVTAISLGLVAQASCYAAGPALLSRLQPLPVLRLSHTLLRSCSPQLHTDGSL